MKVITQQLCESLVESRHVTLARCLKRKTEYGYSLKPLNYVLKRRMGRLDPSSETQEQLVGAGKSQNE